MRNFIILALAISLFSCSETIVEEQLPSKPKTIVKGLISNPKEGTAYVENFKNIRHESEIDKKGQFEIQLDIDEPAYLSFVHGGEHTYLCVAPGDTLSLTLNTEQFDESLKYSGHSSGICNYLAEKILLKEKIVSEELDSLYYLEVDSFLNLTNQYFGRLGTLLQKLKLDKTVDSNFIKREEKVLAYDRAALIFDYEPNHLILTDVDTVVGLDILAKEYAWADVNDPTMLQFPSYRTYLFSYINYHGNKIYMDSKDLQNKPDSGRFQSKFLAIQKTISNAKVKEHLQYFYLINRLKRYSPDKLSSIISNFKSSSKDTEYLNNVESAISQWTSFKKGNKAPEFTAKDINGKQYSLSQFKGKAVVIDFWTTWCGPCKKEAPYFQQLEEIYNHKEIQFLSVSIDRNYGAWEKMMKDKKSHALQLIDVGGAETGKPYLISSIPRFVLIDKFGNIFSTNAGSPSSGNLKNEIDGMLNSKI